MKEYKIFETLFDMMPFGIYITDMDTYEPVYLNSVFKQKFGDPGQKKCYELIFGNDAPCLFCKISHLQERINSKNNQPIVHEQFNDMDDRYYRMEERAIYWHTGVPVKYTIAIDTTEQKIVQNSLAEAHANLVFQSKELESKNIQLQELYQKTKDLAERDYLTGLYNRRFFYEIGRPMLNMAVRQGVSSFLAVMDIDHFKQVNDRFGHQAGDKVLCSIADILRTSFRKSDLIGRIGGEEFALIITDVSTDNAKKLLEKFRRQVEKTRVDIGRQRSVACTISMGVASVVNDDLEHAILIADKLMYEAKNQGRNRVIISPE